jgi:tetratricopeptide (TPR) repeat protein
MTYVWSAKDGNAYPFGETFTYRQHRVEAGDKIKIEQHLAGCTHCAENMNLLVQLPRSPHLESPLTFHQTIQMEEGKTNCPASETIAYYVAGALSPIKQWRLIKHLAGCDRCRQQVSAIFQASADPVSEEEGNILKALPAFEISEHVQAIKKLTLPATTPVVVMPKRKRWLDSLVLNPRPAIALVTILLLSIVGKWWAWPQYQYYRFVRQSERQLVEQYRIYYRNEPRPAGDYRSSDEYQLMGPKEEKQTAEALLQRALTYSQDGETARLRLAQYFLFREMSGSADSLLKLLEAASPQNAAGLNDRGIWLFRRQHYDSAAVFFQRAFALNPRLDEALYNLALVQTQLGDTAAAKTSWKKYLTLDVKTEWHNAAMAQLQELEEKK